MKKTFLIRRLAGAAILVVIGNCVYAQSVTVMGNGAARNCYHAAMQASQFNVTGRDDIEQCTTALDLGSLDLRDRAATYVNRGIVFLHAERYQEALEDFEAAAKLKGDFGEIYINRGNLYFMGRSFQKAIEEYTHAMELGLRQQHVAFLNRGMAYEGLRDYESAEADYKRALEIQPDWNKATRRLEKLLEKTSPS